MVGAAGISGRVAALFPTVCLGRDRHGRGVACPDARPYSPSGSVSLLGWRETPAGPRFRPGTGYFCYCGYTISENAVEGADGAVEGADGAVEVPTVRWKVPTVRHLDWASC